jgi:putative ABC transport system substrate-binding protein
MIRRREFITLLGGAAAAWPVVARAQQADKVVRVGVLGPSVENAVAAPGYQIFLSEMRKLGFTDGQNLVIDFRSTDDDMPKSFAAANELVAAKADVLVANGPEISLQAAAAARPPVPIVMLANNYDPFVRGYVKSLSEPGGNISGVFYQQPELAVKQLELLAEAFPDRKRLAALWDIQSADQANAAERAAQSMSLSLRMLKLENPPYDFDAAFRTLSQDGAQMLLFLSTPAFTPYRARIAELAIQHRLPTMFIFSAYVEAGGLMSYGVDTGPMWRRAAAYVAKILRGAKVSDLPVERANNFEFTVNLKTAKSIGVILPTSILLRADKVIE